MDRSPFGENTEYIRERGREREECARDFLAKRKK
jgi:hypothetical protein